MQTGLLHLHNFLRWIILILLLVSLVKAYSGWQSKRSITQGDKKVWLFTMITAHITLLLGLYQVALGRFGIFNTQLPEGSSAMKDSFYRFYWVEHPVGMIIAIVLITLGYGMAKKQVPDTVKFRKAFYFFLLAFIVIMLSIPWPFRAIIGRPLMP